MNATWPVIFAVCVLMCKLYLLMLYKFNGCFQVHLTSMGSSSELVLSVPLFYIHYDSVYETIKLGTDLFICCTIYFHRNVSPGTCNVLIYVNSFLKFISHRSLLNRMWNDILWLNFCFHDTAPICIPAVAFESPLLVICVFLLSLMHFFRKLSLKMPVWPLSWRSPSISMCVSKQNGLELFKSHNRLGYGMLMQRSEVVWFFVWSEPLAWKQLWNIMALFLYCFLHLELTQTSWPVVSSKQDVKERHAHLPNTWYKPDL